MWFAITAKVFLFNRDEVPRLERARLAAAREAEIASERVWVARQRGAEAQRKAARVDGPDPLSLALAAEIDPEATAAFVAAGYGKQPQP